MSFPCPVVGCAGGFRERSAPARLPGVDGTQLTVNGLASARDAVLRLTPCAVQPLPSGVFCVAVVAVLPTNTSPPVKSPEIVVFVTCSNATVKLSPVDVFPLSHLMVTVEVVGFVYAMSSEQFSLSAGLAVKVRSPLVIPAVPVQPESLPVALSVWVSLVVGDSGGVTVSVPVNVVQVSEPPAGVDDDDGADVVDPDPALLFLDEDPHADRTTMTAINVPVVTTRCLRMRVTSVLVNMCAAPYIAVGTVVGEPLAQ